MKSFDWGGLFRTCVQAIRDLQANKPRPVAPGKPLTAAAALAELDQLEAAIPKIRAFFAAHPGALTAADDLLRFLKSQGVTWAGSAQSGIDAIPSGLAGAEEWLPYIIFGLKEIQPAVTGITGGHKPFGQP